MRCVLRAIVQFPILAAAISVVLGIGAGPAQAWKLKTLYTFTGGHDGDSPNGPLVRDEKTGDIFGTTLFGGDHGGGTLFKVTTDGTETVLHSFKKPTGYQPFAGLIRDSAGNLYGTTCCGEGSIFRLAPDGTYTVLHANVFSEAPLFLDAATGDLYGTNNTVFRLAADGTFTTLYTFACGTDGCRPWHAGVVMDAAGNLYGATYEGGSRDRGTVYKIAPDGTETVLHRFNGRQGKSPIGGVVIDALGNLYGTTNAGGSGSETMCGSRGCGVVFKLTSSGKYTVLHNFTNGEDGALPRGELLLDPSGTIYGTSSRGDGGVIYQIKPSGTFKVIASYSGSSPSGSLMEDKDGNLYGATAGIGTVFELLK